LAVGVTAGAVLGTMYYDLPGGCYEQYYGGVVYYQCGSAWYSPQYAGSDVNYVVVNQPY
jgi:hypothetical protein